MSHVGQGSAMDLMRGLDVPETPEGAKSVDGRPPRTLVDILQDLPSRGQCDELVRLYFDDINATRYPIRRDRFMESYTSIWALVASFSLPPELLHRLPLLFIVLAISALTAPLSTLYIETGLTSAQQGEKRLARANEFYYASRRASAYSDTLIHGRGDLSLVMADLLTVRYLILVRRAQDALPILGCAVFRAQALGLHRHSSVVHNVAPEDDQERRLVWRWVTITMLLDVWGATRYVYHMDRYCALLLGRPLSISDNSCDAAPPQNVNSDGVVLPLSEVTFSSFLVLRDRLARIMGRIVEEAFGIKRAQYETIESIDDELRSWTATIPDALRIRPYGHTDDLTPSHPALIVHRHFLSTEYNFARISLHRPYLGKDSHNPRYKRSRQACLDAAMDDLWARTIFTVPGMENLSTGSYRVTNSIIILGITLLLDQSPETVRSIQRCLSDFMAVRQADTNLLNETKIKEAAFIELLQLKADQSLIAAQSRHHSPAPAPAAAAAISGSAGDAGGPAGAESFDPSVQNLFDLFWIPQALSGSLYDTGVLGLGGPGGLQGELPWGDLDTFMGAFEADMQASGFAPTGDDG